jgi:hypothetical protein
LHSSTMNTLLMKHTKEPRMRLHPGSVAL